MSHIITPDRSIARKFEIGSSFITVAVINYLKCMIQSEPVSNVTRIQVNEINQSVRIISGARMKRSVMWAYEVREFITRI